MSANDRAERAVRAWLAQSVEPPRVPDYLPDLIALTARTSQRPAWTLPERWFSMATLTRVRPAFAPVPWRAMALLALLVALLGSALALYVPGSNPLPKPFGPAANGLVAYDWAGDIYTADPRTGEATAITTGIEQDREPVFSRDGTRIVFQRLVDGEITLVAVDADGGNEVSLDGRFEEGPVSFSPDGTAVLAFAIDVEAPGFRVVPTDGSSARDIAPGFDIGQPVWRPTGNQILFTAMRRGDSSGLYLTDESGVRAVVPPRPGISVSSPQFSPDGSRVVYMEWTHGDAPAQPRVVTVDPGAIEEHGLPPDVAWQDVLGWSNDGKRIALQRSYGGSMSQTLAIVPSSDLSAVGIETPRDVQLALFERPGIEWAPDDSTILALQVDAAGHRVQHTPVLIDPATGEVRPAPWDSFTLPSWQRLAP